jgi:hypothetical protein
MGLDDMMAGSMLNRKQENLRVIGTVLYCECWRFTILRLCSMEIELHLCPFNIMPTPRDGCFSHYATCRDLSLNRSVSIPTEVIWTSNLY